MYNWLLIILLVVAIAIVVALYFMPDKMPAMLQGLGSKLGMKGEGYTSPLLRETKPPIGERLKAATMKVASGAEEALRRAFQPSTKDLDMLKAAIKDKANKIYGQANADFGESEVKKAKHLEDTAAKELIQFANAEVGKLIDQVGVGDEFKQHASELLNGPVFQEVDKVLKYETEERTLQFTQANADQAKIKNTLMDFHFKKSQHGADEIREIEPMFKGYQKKLDIRSRTSADDIVDVLGQDNPALVDNGTLLPQAQPTDVGGVAVNLEIANTVASNRRYYDKVSESQFRSRGGDTRPMIPALVDMVMKQGNSRDPNSLQQSVNYSVLDVLESSRGHAGNERVDQARNQIYNTMSNSFVRDVDEYMEKSSGAIKYGSLLESRAEENRIVDDVLHGDAQEELWQ